MPSSAGGWARGSSIVQIFSLPIATPCSFTPCSAPHSHVGCEPTNADAPASGIRRYCVSSAPPARRGRVREQHLRFVGRPVGVLGEHHAGARCAGTACRTRRVASGASGSAEPDALVVAAHRVQQQRDERAVEDEVDQRAEVGERRRAEVREAAAAPARSTRRPRASSPTSSRWRSRSRRPRARSRSRIRSRTGRRAG